jgi:hypothetical protein
MQHARSCCMQHLAIIGRTKLLYATRSVCEAALCKHARTQLKLLYATRTEAALYGNTRTQLLYATQKLLYATHAAALWTTHTHNTYQLAHLLYSMPHRSCSMQHTHAAALCNTHTYIPACAPALCNTEAALYNIHTQLLYATHTRSGSMQHTHIHTSLRTCSMQHTHTAALWTTHTHTYQLAQLLYATQKPKRPAECGLRAKRSEAISIQFTCFTGTKSTNTPFQYTFLCPEGEAL